ncbi:hypothetical protein PHYPSEUDO_014722 [Phytophthora pseudosyringae]|uniref:Major Facilitator Superfamily (MFS) n=1 Tax=Phytophthora pseudosyringae TaxID=221518 RepID=A0A8T1W3B8_9STRA|nr:hypothetical protein PHYPSEUDO_014722 [Phytophthora pseudosyringae]
MQQHAGIGCTSNAIGAEAGAGAGLAAWGNECLTALAASRFIVGFGAGNCSVCRADVSSIMTINQRLTYVTMLATVVIFGYALTPGLGSLVANTDTYLLGILFNKLTLPGLIRSTCSGIFTLYDGSTQTGDGPLESPRDAAQKKTLSNMTTMPERVVNIGAVVFVFLNFNARYLSYFSIEYFCRSISDVSLVQLGVLVLLLGNVMLVVVPAHLSFPQMAVAEFFVWCVGCPIATAVVVAAFSKLLGGRPQGTLMGMLGLAYRPPGSFNARAGLLDRHFVVVPSVFCCCGGIANWFTRSSRS